MSYEEFINSYGFKHASRLVMRQFPWIKKITIDKDNYNEYNYIYFVELHIDPNIFSETVENAGIQTQTKNWFYPFANLSIIFSNISDKEGQIYSDDIEDIFEKVKNTEAIPSKINLQRKVKVHGYYLI